MIIAVWSVFWPRFASAAPAPSVYIREVMWAGTDRSTADEWLVLANNTADLISLDGWRLTTSSSGNEKLLTNLAGQWIAAHGSLLIASHGQHYEFTGGESALGLDPDLVVSSLSLSNTALQLKLYEPGSAIPVDVAGSGKTPLAGSTKPPTAMERISPILDGTLKSSWLSATISRHLDALSSALAAPDHAGRPAIDSTSLDPVPVGLPVVRSVVVSDPDGDDDVASVSLSCPDGPAALVDTGLSGDPIAGDRSYSGRLLSIASGQTTCLATVTDRSGLNRSQSLTRFSYVRTANVMINELLPNPASGEEFIELSNSDSMPVDLSGWQLDDVAVGGSRPFTLTDTIAGNGYLVIPASRSKLALNNDGDDIRLLNPEGIVIDQTRYGSAKSGQAWARLADQWQWASQPTPNTANQADPASPPASLATVVTPNVATFTGWPAQTVAQLTGRVVALPGTLSRRSWLLDDGTGVAEIYLDHGTFSPLAIGDWVSVTGRRSGTSYPRLLLDVGTHERPIQPAQSIQPRSLAETLMSAPTAPTIVTGQLSLLKVNSKSLEASLSGRSVKLIWSDLTPSKTFTSSLTPGQTVTVTALLTNGDSPTPNLTLRTDDDLTVESVLVSSLAAPILTSLTSSQSPTVSLLATDAVIAQPVRSVRRGISLTATTIISQAADQLLAARWLAEQQLISLTIQAAGLNEQLTSLITQRLLDRTRQWQRIDRSAMVGLLIAIGSLQFLLSWRRFIQTLPWSGG